MHLPEKLHTDKDLARAKMRGRMVGWFQGGAVVIGAGIVLNLLGWIPTVLAVGVVAYIAYKLLSGSSNDDPNE